MANFDFLKACSPMLYRLAQFAERYYLDDPNTALVKMRQYSEVFVQEIGALTRTRFRPGLNAAEKINTLKYEGSISEQVVRALHLIRKEGNKAAHDPSAQFDAAKALSLLQLARALGSYYYQLKVDPNFKLPPFVPPQSRPDKVKAQLEALQAQLVQAHKEKALAEAVAQEEAERRAELEAQAQMALAQQQQEQLVPELSLAEEEEHEAVVAVMVEEAESRPKEERHRIVARAERLDLELNEEETRLLIDEQLQEAGWWADSKQGTYAQGVRPQKNSTMAIAEWPTASGPADYVLFIGLQPVAVIEAKRQSEDVAGALQQAERYARGLNYDGATEQSWGLYKVPFVFATNGRPFLRQLVDKSGVWFRDVRSDFEHPRALSSWYSPSGLQDRLRQNIEESHKRLTQDSLTYLGLRPYQEQAIQALEQGLIEGRQAILLAMATGTGKTRTAVSAIYRLLKAKRFRRVLFVVDRSELGRQAYGTFTSLQMEGMQTFAEIYEVQSLGPDSVADTTKVHIATVQSLVRKCLLPQEEQLPLPVDTYDCIVVDECHRGYNLDQEMSELELEIRSEHDYISRYRRVLDHFDAVKIGLTATPALHTVEIFGQPIFQYSYRQAVVDGYLCDHEPPIQIKTELSLSGITWEAGEHVEVYHAGATDIETTVLDDTVHIPVAGFNRMARTENFNRVVCEALAEHLEPEDQAKTLIFCVTDEHCDTVVRLLSEALQNKYGAVRHDLVTKITGQAHRPDELLRRYKNEQTPQIAVTVDLLTTGVDVPAIDKLVFLRRVQSRILYEQMLGRGTRLCPAIEKTAFQIFDAVGLYEAMDQYSSMKPVVHRPKIPVSQLVTELEQAQGWPEQRELIEQLVSKLARQKWSESRKERFQELAGQTPVEALQELRQWVQRDGEDEQACVAAWQAWFEEQKPWLKKLDEVFSVPLKSRGTLIADHEDALVSIERGYGAGLEKPQDYLDHFGQFLKEHMNDIPALLVVTQRPQELSRAELKELEKQLAQAGYSREQLRHAWRDVTNQDIVASIIGFIRQQALGSPLVPFDHRVDQALLRIQQSYAWSDKQRKWLDRIARQLKQETIVDPVSVDESEAFRSYGGFKRMNQIFEGRFGKILADFLKEVWTDEPA